VSVSAKAEGFPEADVVDPVAGATGARGSGEQLKKMHPATSPESARMACAMVSRDRWFVNALCQAAASHPRQRPWIETTQIARDFKAAGIDESKTEPGRSKTGLVRSKNSLHALSPSADTGDGLKNARGRGNQVMVGSTRAGSRRLTERPGGGSQPVT
jgi:hypothetical protein